MTDLEFWWSTFPIVILAIISVLASVGKLKSLANLLFNLHRGRNGSTEEASVSSKTTAIRDQLVGIWQLETYEHHIYGRETSIHHPFGKEPSGMIVYTRDGYMSVHLIQPGCPTFATENYHSASAEELAEAAKRYMGYAGTYTVEMNADMQVVVNHSVDVTLFPNWIGTTQTRIVNLKGDQLTLSPQAWPDWKGMKVEAVLRWKRPKKN
ncbi:Lipocalin-like domain containing protein [Elaphomyces granulatus]